MHGKEERNMKNFKTKLLAMILVFATVFGSVPQTVQADDIYADSDQVCYLSGKNSTKQATIGVYHLSKNSKVTNIKSSKKSVVKLSSCTLYSFISSGNTTYLDSDAENSSWNDPYYYAEIAYTAKKAGTSKITCKVGKKSFTTKITVKNYTNPLKTVKISGLKDGKDTNLKGLVDSDSTASALTLGSTQKDATIEIATKKGWAITSAELYDNNTSTTYSAGNWSGQLSSVTLKPGTLKKGGNYSLSITLYNLKDYGTISVTYTIN
jgi:hypothetical protein